MKPTNTCVLLVRSEGVLVEWEVTTGEKVKDCYDPYQYFDLIEHVGLLIRKCMGSCSYEWVLSSQFAWPTCKQ